MTILCEASNRFEKVAKGPISNEHEENKYIYTLIFYKS